MLHTIRFLVGCVRSELMPKAFKLICEQFYQSTQAVRIGAQIQPQHPTQHSHQPSRTATKQNSAILYKNQTPINRIHISIRRNILLHSNHFLCVCCMDFYLHHSVCDERCCFHKILDRFFFYVFLQFCCTFVSLHLTKTVYKIGDFAASFSAHTYFTYNV